MIFTLASLNEAEHILEQNYKVDNVKLIKANFGNNI